ncbi:hypothetical protein NQ315_016893 [Exocentrus adspersus]|uniref:Uncharacterized protein n=1 Tax=Exocentrus adspersus TaxID=1586481 RepID=A0AAV8VY99_9CUCU|nr:hypothetical protein NQ315_016893 [Exocentrus adspersus]
MSFFNNELRNIAAGSATRVCSVTFVLEIAILLLIVELIFRRKWRFLGNGECAANFKLGENI